MNLENLLKNKPIFKFVYGPINSVWGVLKTKWLVNISELSKLLKRERKTIKNGLKWGSYIEIINDVGTKPTQYYYSCETSNFHHIKIQRTKDAKN